MYNQYIKTIETELGPMKFEYTYKTVNNVTELDTLLLTYKNKTIQCPKAWAKQTSTTIIKKVCAMERGLK